jgi:hypothetical protein
VGGGGWVTEFEKLLKQILKECSGFGLSRREEYSISNEFLWYSVIRIIAKILSFRHARKRCERRNLENLKFDIII